MNELQLREAKANLSAVIDSARQGEPTIITRRGKPAAVVVSFEEWERLSSVPSFGRLLMAAPIGPDDLPERDPSLSARPTSERVPTLIPTSGPRGTLT